MKKFYLICTLATSSMLLATEHESLDQLLARTDALLKHLDDTNPFYPLAIEDLVIKEEENRLTLTLPTTQLNPCEAVLTGIRTTGEEDYALAWAGFVVQKRRGENVTDIRNEPYIYVYVTSDRSVSFINTFKKDARRSHKSLTGSRDVKKSSWRFCHDKDKVELILEQLQGS